MIKVTQNRLNKNFNSWLELVQREQQISSADAERENQKKQAALDCFEAKLIQIKEKYAPKALEKYPPILFPHQIPLTDRSDFKFEIDELRRKGKIMVFKLAMTSPSKAIVFIKDLTQWFKQYKSSNHRIMYFIQQVLPRMKSMRVRKSELTDLNVTERDIKNLINTGFLVCVQESVYELTIPCAGEYSKSFLKGRSCLIATLNKSSEKELLKSELLSNDTIKKRMFLGLDFHIADIVGLRFAESIETTAGQLIRYILLD